MVLVMVMVGNAVCARDWVARRSVVSGRTAAVWDDLVNDPG